MPTDRTGRGSLDPRTLLTSLGEVVYDWDIAADALTWGANAAEVFRCHDMGRLSTGKDLARAVEPGSGPTRSDAVLDDRSRDEGSGVAYRIRYRLRLGARILDVEDVGRWFAGADGAAAFAHGICRVAPAGEPASPQARQELRTRAAFLVDLAADVASCVRPGRAVTVLVAAIEELGRLNEDLGFDGAEAVIAEVQARMMTVMRRRDRYAAYSGNRFALALLSCPAEQAELAARRLVAAVEHRPVVTGRGPRLVRLRVGAATAPDHAADAASLLRRAEEALAQARSWFGTAVALYDPASLREAARKGRDLSTFDLVSALNDRRVRFALQPVVDARSRQPVFSEALVRVRDSHGRDLRATQILPGAERAGLMPLLDARVLALTADHLARHAEERLSINVSPTTIESPGWLTMLAAELGARPGVASRLIIEVVETAAVRDAEGMRARLDAMKALGVGIAIDDFGAGHTSFRHLRSFPVDILKIDGAFVQNLARSADDRFFVRTLIDLAHHLGIATVAEWVEDEATARMLAGWGVDYLQGDHCGVPLLAEDAPPIEAARVA